MHKKIKSAAALAALLCVFAAARYVAGELVAPDDSSFMNDDSVDAVSTIDAINTVEAVDTVDAVFACDYSDKATVLPAPTAQKLPRWKGFNLLYFFNTTSFKPVDEATFRRIASFGFNFVRLPIDYRCLIVDGDWYELDEKALLEIDKALEFGKKYDIHICLNLHRAPGYTVASPPEKTDLWRQPEPQEAFARMWGAFAKRYRNVPSEYLSFNLVNEPPDIDEALYANVAGKAANAIWAQDPDRIVIADGLAYAVKPSKTLADLGLAQATRGYQPFNLTHYKAEWVNNADAYPPPAWPDYMLPMYLYGYAKNDIRSIYDIEYDFTEAYTLDINVGVVSDKARLIVKADGDEVYNRLFISGAGTGEWKTAVYAAEWNIYQNVFDRDYRVEIPAGTKRLTIEVGGGDWMSVNGMKFAPASGAGKTFTISPNNADWGAAIPPLKVDRDGRLITDDKYMQNGRWLRETYLAPWEELARGGCGVFVGEWGAYNKTPHDVVLRWMEDCLVNFDEAGVGWALWNFDDAFGVLDSGRADVAYENYEGHKLDRKMLELLQKYL